MERRNSKAASELLQKRTRKGPETSPGLQTTFETILQPAWLCCSVQTPGHFHFPKTMLPQKELMQVSLLLRPCHFMSFKPQLCCHESLCTRLKSHVPRSPQEFFSGTGSPSGHGWPVKHCSELQFVSSLLFLKFRLSLPEELLSPVSKCGQAASFQTLEREFKTGLSFKR